MKPKNNKISNFYVPTQSKSLRFCFSECPKVDDFTLEDIETDNKTYCLIPNGISDGCIFTGNYAKLLKELHIAEMTNYEILAWLQSEYPNTDYSGKKDKEMEPVLNLNSNNDPLLKNIPEEIKSDLALLSHTL